MFQKKLLSVPSLQCALVAAGIALSLAVCATAAAAETKTVVYATRGDRELTLTVHYPDQWQADDTRPAIVFFFGGGWNAGSTEQFLPQAEYFPSRGLVTARADYRVKSRDGVTPDACVRDARLSTPGGQHNGVQAVTTQTLSWKIHSRQAEICQYEMSVPLFRVNIGSMGEVCVPAISPSEKIGGRESALHTSL